MFIKKLIVVLNKVDCLEEKVIPAKIAALRKVFSKTKFGDNVTMVPIQQNKTSISILEI